MMTYNKIWMLFFKVQSKPMVKKFCSVLAIFLSLSQETINLCEQGKVVYKRIQCS